MKPCCARLALILCLAAISARATTPSTAATPASSTSPPSSVAPPMVSFAGPPSDLNGKGLTGVQGVTFALYKDPRGGAPLWLENLNVGLDSNRHYLVMLGSTTADGLPAGVFSSGDARWLGAHPADQPEQARVIVARRAVCIEGRRRADLGGAAAFGLHAVGSSRERSELDACGCHHCRLVPGTSQPPARIPHRRISPRYSTAPRRQLNLLYCARRA
jgi:hypothetical protein